MIKAKVTIKGGKHKEFRHKIEELAKPHTVPLTETMPDSFIRQNTDFQTLQELFDASGVEDPKEIKSKKFSQFIAARTRFSNWEEMLKAAGREYNRRRLGL